MRRAMAVFAPLLVVLLLAMWRAQGPAAGREDAPPDEFSSARAMKVLRAILVDDAPHPIGSPENSRLRARIETQFHALGYETTLQRRFACNAAAVCGVVENIIARAPGAPSPATVLLAAHYDSVPAGPGASDDGMGVAALLEIARAVRGERHANSIAFLVDDGEEVGLLGAEAFVADPTLSADVAVVINVENRGTYGPSNMFETSRGNRWLIRHLSNSVPRPQASSLFYAIYNLLPNDTDVTVFKRQGIAALNFASIRGVSWYHTPLDDLHHASPRTLQHHGESVLALTRTLADADLDARSRTDATYFDVLGFSLIWWPQEWTLWIAIVSLVLLVFAARRLPPREMTFGVLSTFAAILFSLLAGIAVASLTRLRSHDLNFVAQPWPSIAAMWLTGIACALFAASLFRRRAQPLPMLVGVGIVWHMIGIALSLALGGAAFLFVVPSVVLMICAFGKLKEGPSSAVTTTAAAILMFPLGLVLYDALGGRLMVIIAVVIGALATLFAPLFARIRVALSVAALALVSAFVAVALPSSNAKRPRPLSIMYVDDATSPTPEWIVDDLTGPMRATANFSPGAAPSAPAPRHFPRVTMTGERTASGVRIRIRSNRGAPRLIVRVKDGKVMSVNGVTPPPRPSRFRDRSNEPWQYAVAIGVDEMVVEVAAKGPVEAIASDASFGLPPSGAAIARARDASNAVPLRDGDVTITRVRRTF